MVVVRCLLGPHSCNAGSIFLDLVEYRTVEIIGGQSQSLSGASIPSIRTTNY